MIFASPRIHWCVLLVAALLNAPRVEAAICVGLREGIHNRIAKFFYGEIGVVARRYKFNLNKPLARGSSGAVYLGEAPTDLRLSNGKVVPRGLQVIVKVAGSDDLLMTKFLTNEFVMAQRLGDTCSCFLGSTIADGALVREWIPGSVTLVAFMDPDHLRSLGPQVTPQLITDFKSQLNSIFEVLRKSNIVHGDIHPSNVLVVEENNVYRLKLIDFGAAAVLGGFPAYDDQSVGIRTFRPGYASGNQINYGPASFVDDEKGAQTLFEWLDRFHH